jgi:hypothetical protein
MFELLDDIGGMKGATDTALEMRSLLPMDGKLAKYGLFITHNGTKISLIEFELLCASEESDIGAGSTDQP